MSLSRKHRTAVLLTFVVLCIGFLAWMGYFLWRGQPRSVAAIHGYGGYVHYDYQWAKDRVDHNVPSPTPWLLRKLVGDSLFHPVVHVSLVYDYQNGQRVECNNPSDEVLVHLTSFPHLKSVGIHGTQATDRGMTHLGKIPSLGRLYMWDASVSDAGLAELSGLTELHYLHVSNSKITDRSLAILGKMARLEGLSLQGNHFTDAGLAHLAGLERLKSLWLGKLTSGTTRITDAGIPHLSKLEQLEKLDIQGSLVTDAGLLELRLPNLKRLVVGGSQGITEQGLEAFRAANPEVDVD